MLLLCQWRTVWGVAILLLLFQVFCVWYAVQLPRQAAVDMTAASDTATDTAFSRSQQQVILLQQVRRPSMQQYPEPKLHLRTKMGRPSLNLPAHRNSRGGVLQVDTFTPEHYAVCGLGCPGPGPCTAASPGSQISCTTVMPCKASWVQVDS
jgi:hypothetical protein